MPAEDESNPKGWLSNIDLPDWLKSRTVKALDQLLGGFVEIPAAHLKGLAKKVEAKHDRDIKFDNVINAEAIKNGQQAKTFEARALAAHELRISRYQFNKQKIAQKSLKYLENNDANNIENIVDVDWLEIFGSRAEKVSNEHMQQIWAKILAGEINSPGKFSLSTLMLLSNLSKTDAELISSFSSKVWSESIIDECEGDEGFYKNEVIRLHELGIILDPRNQTFQHTHSKQDGFLSVTTANEYAEIELNERGKEKFSVHTNRKEIMGVPVLSLTQEGRDLMSILPEPTIENLVDALNEILPNFARSISVYKLISNKSVKTEETKYGDEILREIKCS